jgi:hypothetical protein
MRGGHGWRLMEQWHVSVRELNRERSEPVTRSGERGPRQHGVSCTSPSVQPLHTGVQNDTTMGLTPEKLLIGAFLHGLTQGCFENRLGHNVNLLQATKWAGFC